MQQSGYDLLAICRHMVDAARLGGGSLVEHFRNLSAINVIEKGPSDFVSIADLQSEEIVVSHLAATVPGVPVLGEERGGASALMADACIVVDPLDGTNNFLHGIPHFSCSLAFFIAGEPVIGVTFNPMNDDLFQAVRGGGAFLGETRLTGSPRQTLPHAVVGTCFPYHGKGDIDLCPREMAEIMPHVSGVRSPGSAALEIAYVAEGRFDAFWSHGARLDLWDVAAGIVIAREAGCIVTGPDGMRDPLDCEGILAAPSQYHQALADLLGSVV